MSDFAPKFPEATDTEGIPGGYVTPELLDSTGFDVYDGTSAAVDDDPATEAGADSSGEFVEIGHEVLSDGARIQWGPLSDSGLSFEFRKPDGETILSAESQNDTTKEYVFADPVDNVRVVFTEGGGTITVAEIDLHRVVLPTHGHNI